LKDKIMQQHKVMGIFSYPDNLLSALRAAGQAQLKVNTVFSPVPHHGIQQALGMKTSPVRFATLFGGIAGILSGVGLAVYAHLRWNLITSGKPVLAWLPFCVVAFEFCILIGFLATLVTMLVANRMPRFRLPACYDPRFSRDRFGLLLSCAGGQREQAAQILKDSGAEEVHEVSG
jgi:hypothetical protein